MSHADKERRTGDQTRAAIRNTALRLFTEQGFEGTSIKDIADAVGTTKSSLYYHFASKDEIIRSILDERSAEFEELWTWAKAQPRTGGLLEQVAFRWLESVTDSRLDAMRFAMANGPAMRRLASEGGAPRPWLDEIIQLIVGPEPSVRDILRARMPFEMLAAALAAARGTTATTDDIVSTARTAMAEIAASRSNASPASEDNPRRKTITRK